ncbi:T9SS type A sorting domain-containing protein [Nonlabens xiamenensis]|uniref:T9SS type A sorting domain-containing protein n=1 Tax=Nonlabens xiamenensis TaxID=2341043 RepID=UPI000F615E35|nr:T9SS type A sorting domain-containing protein [Nonlabens xiamenensis]
MATTKNQFCLLRIRLLMIFLWFCIPTSWSYAYTIYNCSTTSELRNAMGIANPGDEIIIMPGTYEPSGKVMDAIGKFVRFTSDRSGTPTQPIILRGSSSTNRPLLQCPDNDIYDGAILSITGDYWDIRDLRIEQGDKGIMLDTANYCTLTNIDVQDIGEEGIHIRSGSSHNTIISCSISNTGVNSAGFGEGIYIGSDRSQHSTYNPDCNYNTIDNCIMGPNIRAEHFDIKEGTEYNVVKNCIMDGTGITGANFSDSFMDIKGIYTFIYFNTFQVNGNTNIASMIDFNNRMSSSYTYKTGYRNSFFGNTFELGTQTSIPTATSRGAVSNEIHVFDNVRNPSSPWIKTPNTAASTDAYEFCPSWNIVSCSTLGNTEVAAGTEFLLYPNPADHKLYINMEDLSSYQIKVIDLNGQVISQIAVGSDHIDISRLASGSYVLQLSSNTQQLSQVFIKE